MTSPTIEEYRAEYDREVVGPLLLELLTRIVSATARTYPPVEYSDAHVWSDEALEDALYGWIERKLLRCGGGLQEMLLRANRVEHFRSMLTTSFGQFLTSRRPRTSASNLYTRTKKTLQGAPFRPVGAHAAQASKQLYALQDGPEEPSQLGSRALLAFAHELDDESLAVVRYGPYSLKSSPILRSEGLKRFLEHLIRRAEGALSLEAIAEVQRQRFNLPSFDPVELTETLASDEETTVELVERTELARSVLLRAGEERLAALAAFNSTDTLKDAARKLGWSPALLSARLHEVTAMIAEFADNEVEAAAVFQELLRLI